MTCCLAPLSLQDCIPQYTLGHWQKLGKGVQQGEASLAI